MEVVQLRWPEARRRLARELADDLYVRVYLMQVGTPDDCIFVTGAVDARNVMTMSPEDEWDDVWLEARDDDARALLHTLPQGRNVHLTTGTRRGLELVQEEFEGRVGVFNCMCVVDRVRFRPRREHAVARLTKADREALQRYPPALNRDVNLQLFDAGEVDLYGCYREGELIGVAAAGMRAAGTPQVEVDVRAEFRGQGIGRSLLSATVADLLCEHERVLYFACMESMANLRLALAVGFVPVRQNFHFEGRRKP